VKEISPRRTTLATASVLKKHLWIRGETTMKRRLTLTTGLLLFVAVLAMASSVHLKGGPNAEPSFTDLGKILEASSALSGLGNGDVLISLTAQANVTSTCTNQGGNAAPGQNPAPITVTGSEAIPAGEIKNGTTPFDVFTNAPTSPIAGAPDCSNSNWTETIDDLLFTSATITVEQPVGNLVLTLSCKFSSPTTNGAVPGSHVTCTQQ
jgi:hypothetical protein